LDGSPTGGQNGAPIVIAWVRVSGWARLFFFEELTETFGDLMQPTEDYPRRYRVRQFPDENTIDAIGSTELG